MGKVMYLDQLLTNPAEKSRCATGLNPFIMFYLRQKSLKYPAESGIKSHIVSGQNHICDISTITVGEQ